MISKLKIGSLELDNNIVLAPMAGISDFPLRTLAKEGGAGMVYTEMVSSKALSFNSQKTKSLLQTDPRQKPVAFQIFGGDVYSMREGAKILCDLGADIIDINLGCPVRKIAKAGAGAKLLENENLIGDILDAVVKTSTVPVTIKTRLGLIKGQETASRIVEIAFNCGIKAAAIHCRYANQGHSGDIDIETFADVCARTKMPIFANGSILDEKTAKIFSDIKGCSGLMIGRGAIGNYNIFERIKFFLESGKHLPIPSQKEKTEWFKKHFDYALRYYGEKRAIVLMRKTMPYYFKDFPNASNIRTSFNQINSKNEFENFIEMATEKADKICDNY